MGTHELRCECGFPTIDMDAPFGPEGFYCGRCGYWRDEPAFTKEEKMTKFTRGEVYAAIDSERAYQDMRRDRDQGQPEHSLEEFLLYMKVYLDQAFTVAATTWGPEATPKTLEVLRKVTALGVAAMEQHGAPQRAGFTRFIRYDEDTGTGVSGPLVRRHEIGEG